MNKELKKHWERTQVIDFMDQCAGSAQPIEPHHIALIREQNKNISKVYGTSPKIDSHISKKRYVERLIQNYGIDLVVNSN